MSNFFSQKNVNKKDVYDVSVDKQIISVLKDYTSIGHGKLKIATERILNRTISPGTFSKHLERLTNKGLIKKEEHGIGRKTDYSLTELALKKLSLGLLGNDQDKVDLLKRVYSTIFFYDAHHLPEVTTSEKEFERLLARFELNKNDLNWGWETYAENADAANLAYGVGSSHTFFDHRYWQTYFEFWKNRDGKMPVLKEIKYFAIPKRDISLDFEIERIDYWQFNKRFPIYNYLKEYYLYLPGFSGTDIRSIHTDINPDLLQDGLNRLEKMGLIKELIVLNGGTRFMLSDDSLRNLLAAAWTIHRDGEFDRLIDKWSFFDSPTEDETRRMEILLGRDEAGRIFDQIGLKRSKFNVFKRKCESANELHKYIMWEWTPKIAKPDMGNRSSMPDSEDLKFLYRISNDFKDIVFVQRLNQFKDMKKNGKIVFKNRTKNEAEEYFEFLREGLYRELKYLPFSAAEDNIEDIKITLRDTILNYAFLEDIIREICPKILEPIDEDIQQEIEEIEAQSKMRANMTDLIYVIKQRIKCKMTVREIRERSKIHEFQASLKSDTVFHYDIQKTFNPITQRFEHREIFHILNQKELESGKFSEVHMIERAYNPITQRMEELPVIHFLDTNKAHTKRNTKDKSKKSK